MIYRYGLQGALSDCVFSVVGSLSFVLTAGGAGCTEVVYGSVKSVVMLLCSSGSLAVPPAAGSPYWFARVFCFLECLTFLDKLG